MKKLSLFLAACSIVSFYSLAYATDVYTETLISHELIGGGSAMGWHADDGAWPYTLPFAFPFYGSNYTSVNIGSNGLLCFESNAGLYSNNDDSLKSLKMIAPLWDDLMTNAGDADIYIHQPTSDSVCIRWHAIQYRTNIPTEFEVVLSRNGDIKFNYGQTSSALSPTIGISKGDGINFLLSSKNNSASLNNAQSSLFRLQTSGNQSPTATVSPNLTNGAIPLTVQFTGNGVDSDGTIASYQWNFGDGTISNTQSPSHIYTTAGSFTATLTVTDNGGATGSASVVITAQQGVVVGIPKLIRFQAKLSETQGIVLPGINNILKLTFKIYDAASGGTPLWQEVQPSVVVSDGVVDVELGSVTPLELAFDKQYWLGVEVASDGEMAPRFKLTTTPYSFSTKAVR